MTETNRAVNGAPNDGSPGTPNIATSAVPVNSLPTTRALLRSTAIAAATAAVLLFTVVLPAEYGVDPTGIGRVLGLTQMGEIKRSLALEAEAATAAEVAAAQAAPGTARGSDATAPVATAPVATAPVATAPSAAAPTVTAPIATGPAVSPPAPAAASVPAAGAKVDAVHVILQPGEGKEIKLAMRKGARVQYRWATDQGVVNYDTHADRTAPPAISYFGYGKGQGKASDEGVLVAAFDGMHGWFWRNRTSGPVTITLRTEGDYQELKRME